MVMWEQGRWGEGRTMCLPARRVHDTIAWVQAFHDRMDQWMSLKNLGLQAFAAAWWLSYMCPGDKFAPQVGGKIHLSGEHVVGTHCMLVQAISLSMSQVIVIKKLEGAVWVLAFDPCYQWDGSRTESQPWCSWSQFHQFHTISQVWASMSATLNFLCCSLFWLVKASPQIKGLQIQ